MDPVLDLLIQAHGELLGRLVFGSYRLAQTATEHAHKRSEAEVALQTVRDATAAQGEVRP